MAAKFKNPAPLKSGNKSGTIVVQSAERQGGNVVLTVEDGSVVVSGDQVPGELPKQGTEVRIEMAADDVQSYKDGTQVTAKVREVRSATGRAGTRGRDG